MPEKRKIIDGAKKAPTAEAGGAFCFRRALRLIWKARFVHLPVYLKSEHRLGD